jgi:hypothetical protein
MVTMTVKRFDLLFAICRKLTEGNFEDKLDVLNESVFMWEMGFFDESDFDGEGVKTICQIVEFRLNGE